MPKAYHNEGDAISGKLILCQSSTFPQKPTKVKLTSKHRGWRFSIDDAYCIIDKAYRWKKESTKKLSTVDDKNKKKKKPRRKKMRKEKR